MNDPDTMNNCSFGKPTRIEETFGFTPWSETMNPQFLDYGVANLISASLDMLSCAAQNKKLGTT
eukprot:522070-Amphidinium_carterae.2